MIWEVVKIDQTSGKTVPFVSIGRGMLDFNAVACELVNDNGSYKFAQLFTGKEKGKPVVAVKFLEEYIENSIPIKRKTTKEGKIIKGMTIANKGVVEELFGKEGKNNGMLRHKVELVKDEENMLRILDA
jgi:hypothetical protein